MFGEKCDSKNHQIRVSPKISDQTGEGDADGWFLWSYWMTIKYHAPNEQRDPDNHYLLLQDCGFLPPIWQDHARSMLVWDCIGYSAVVSTSWEKWEPPNRIYVDQLTFGVPPDPGCLTVTHVYGSTEAWRLHHFQWSGFMMFYASNKSLYIVYLSRHKLTSNQHFAAW